MNIPSISPLPAFYKCVFSVFAEEREPVLWGTRLDLPSWEGHSLATRLQTAGCYSGAGGGADGAPDG